MGSPLDAVHVAGVGIPSVWGRLRPGEVVVEVGSGAGLDALLAARQVGPAGRVVGVDMTPAMLQKARANAALVGAANLELRAGLAEALPVPDAGADVVTSNGVINQCPDQAAVFRELYRVLKPGGRLQLADIVEQRPVPPDAREDVDLWTGCIAGALPSGETRAAIEAAGFVAVRSSERRWGAFGGSPSESSAYKLGTQSVASAARKPRGGGETMSGDPLPTPDTERAAFGVSHRHRSPNTTRILKEAPHGDDDAHRAARAEPD
jgi:arsenite methyltransferase